jgi:hypothetical protein
VAFLWFIADFRESPMSHQNIQVNSAAALVPARLATSRLLPERALQANSRKPQDSPASSLPQPPLQRGTISNFCSLCGRLLAGDLSRANAAQQPRKKRSFRLFPEIRDEPFLCLSHLSTTLARACQQAKCLVLVNAIRLQASSHKTIT